MKELREWANFIFTILGAAAIVYLNLRFDNQRLEIEAAATATYETQTAHTRDMQQLTDANNRMQQGQADLKLAVQHLSDVMAVRRSEGTPRNPINNN